MSTDPYCVRCNPHGLFGTYEYYVGADCGNHDEPEEPKFGFCAWCNVEDVLDANDMCRKCRKNSVHECGEGEFERSVRPSHDD